MSSPQKTGPSRTSTLPAPQPPRDPETGNGARVPHQAMPSATVMEDGVHGDLVSHLEYKDQANSYIHYVNDTSVPIAQARPVHPSDNDGENNNKPMIVPAVHPTAALSGTDGQYMSYGSNPTATSTITYENDPPVTTTTTTTTPSSPTNGATSRKSSDPASPKFDWMKCMKKYGFAALFLGIAIGVAVGVVVGRGGGDNSDGPSTSLPEVRFDLKPDITDDSTDLPIGFSVSLDGDGTRMCVADQSFVHVYDEQGADAWTALGSPIAPPNGTRTDSSAGDGNKWIRVPVICRLSADGKIVAVGWSTFQENTGYVQVYRYEETDKEWRPKGQALTGASPDNVFGAAFDLDRDGGVLAVGSPGNGGSVDVYFFNVGSWEVYGNQISSQIGDMIIVSVALSWDGDTLGIAGQGGSDGCVTKVLRRQEGVWQPLGNCITGSQDGTAYTVDLAGDEGTILAISNYYLGEQSSTNNEDIDSRVFELVSPNEFSTADGEWVQLGETLHAQVEGEKEGYFISLSDDGRVLVMGDPGRGAQNQGHAHIYVYDGSNWNQLGDDVLGEAAGDQFGYSVSIANNGKRFAVGSPFSRVLGTRDGHGRVLVYEIP